VKDRRLVSGGFRVLFHTTGARVWEEEEEKEEEERRDEE